MKIAFCTPFKPVDHPNVSGDVTIARDLLATLRDFGHRVEPLPFYPAREIYRRPWSWPAAARALGRMVEAAQDADCWLTHGSYYKVPDIFGPTASARLSIPYFLFQASYARNRARHIATWPGYALNKRAMLRADHVFCNRINDLAGCAKILPGERYSHVSPGLPDGLFGRDEAARQRHRAGWGAGPDTVVAVCAAMMRPGVKAVGVQWTIRACAAAARTMDKGRDLLLVVAGDGPMRTELEVMARAALGEGVRFLGRVDRTDLPGVFSAGDLFAFPGLKESVGMVYLEAQHCGLPVVATDDEGAPHVVAHEVSGLITSASEADFAQGVATLVRDADMRARLGSQAPAHVGIHHSLSVNYLEMARTMERITATRRPGQ
ncbi:glycosyltransferase [Pseudodesulfovibrio sp. F-1]|uniref:Glycosyltransferase n=1 Tax=Pseudodesulfovibrio alkaliphilus TaxID=2661613 RepID=A0A7K1KNV3_9BACT|nr:glycosyltransferase [Pseudodesulfovibrio alkaliphilus]